MKKLIIPILLFSSCSTHQLLEANYVKRSPIEKSHTIPTLKNTEIESVTKNRWQALIFISNDYSNPDLYRIPDSLCEKSDILTNVSSSLKTKAFPILWITQDHTISGVCHE
ncbi:hypothetical protein [Bacteriovorax sp. Seq25_V]|uniref:hypothetical protein n=1 Tax=Bacteriovorax sp. Seq25_V TaxID=1201288 RepID=UPI00054F8A12|nr:hypothetical protein [Bacteriovorax sp. Seq25_V]